VLANDFIAGLVLAAVSGDKKRAMYYFQHRLSRPTHVVSRNILFRLRLAVE
jgi:hypothetical protein